MRRILSTLLSRSALLLAAGSIAACAADTSTEPTPPGEEIGAAAEALSADTGHPVWAANQWGTYRYSGRGNWQKMQGVFKQIAVVDTNNVWAVDASGNIFHWAGSAWEQIQGWLTGISAAPDGTVCGVAGNSQMTAWCYLGGNQWRQMPGSAWAQIATGGANRIWAINTSQQIFVWNGSGWSQVPGALTNISVGSDGSVWGVSSDGYVWRYVGGSAVWQQMPMPGPMKQIAVASATEIWTSNAAGNLYRWLGGNTWEQVPGNAPWVSVSPSVVGPPSPPGTSSSVLFRDNSTLRGSSADWDPYHGKAGCGPGEAIVGISDEIDDREGRRALCRSSSGATLTGAVTANLLFTNGGADMRRAQRAGDWAPGYWKLECGAGEYVSGVSEDYGQFQGNNRFHGVQCSQGSGLPAAGACTVRTFDSGDNRGYNSSGDWDYGAYKGECAVNEYVAGVSVSMSTGGPHSLLCCAGPPEPMNLVPGHGFWGTGADREFDTASAQACHDACVADASCTGGTFNPAKHHCWLRTGSGPIVSGLSTDNAFQLSSRFDPSSQVGAFFHSGGQDHPAASYGRGVGTVPANCPSGYENAGLLCVQTCPSGYTDTGLLCEPSDIGNNCSGSCPSGYTNWGCFCRFNGSTFTKSNAGSPTCAPDQDTDAGLCYPKCEPGYDGVGPVCWLGSLSDGACQQLYDPGLAQAAKNSQSAMTYGVGVGGEVGLTLGNESGVVYGPNGEFGCYNTTYVGTATNVALDFWGSLGLWTSFDDVAGNAIITSVGAGEIVGFTAAQVWNEHGFVGSVNQVEVTAGLLPVEAALQSANTSVNRLW